MRPGTRACLAALTLWIMAPVPAAGQRHARLASRIDSMARATLAKDLVPGLSVAVLRDNDVILARGYGYADLEDSLSASEHTVYRVASITKLFTAAAVLRLSQTGRLRLADSVTTYLPPYLVLKKPVTVRHLLAHVSGLRPLDGLDRDMPGTPVSPADVVEHFVREPPAHPPGERFSYSNSGYYLLGVIIERASGLPYFEYLRSHILEPAGLSTTTDCASRPGEAAWGYQAGAGGFVRANAHGAGPGFAAGGLCSTVLDLAKTLRALRDRKVINALSWRQMTAPVELDDGSRASYGYGLALGTLEKHRSVSHGGALPGFSGLLAYYPDDRLSIALLANTESAPLRRLAEHIARAALGLVEPEVKNLPLREFSRYEGTFDLDGVRLVIYHQDGFLHARLGEADGLKLLYQGGHEFAIDADPSLRFVFRVKDGESRSVAFRAGGMDAVANRVP